jgi:AraC-like DNA-binding protein
MVLRGEYNRAYHQAGKMPANMLTLGIPDPGCGDFRWCGKEASGGQIVNFSLESGFDGTSGAGFAGFAISFHEELLQKTLETLELSIDLKRVFGAREVWPRSRHVTNRLRDCLHTAYRTAHASNHPDTVELFNFSAAAFILRFLAESKPGSSISPLCTRRRAVRKALEFLEDEDTIPLTVSGLCKRVGVSAPTLYRAFQEEFSVGPKKYIQFRRLDGVRHELLSEDNRKSITDIANGWGFWHMGQFAADYREHFGEMPSETSHRTNLRPT